ncbi:MAG: fatty acid desaturase [candidate division KSB1 bacterium]
MRKNQTHEFADARYAGILVAVFVMAAWGVSLASLLHLGVSTLPIWGAAAAVLLQTFLYTGLFLTAHDRMHGLLAPRHPRVNNFIGALCVLLYALFSFQRLKAEHRKHHAQPGSGEDPGSHDGKHAGLGRGYFHFMHTFVTWQQLLGVALAFNLMHHLLKIPISNLLLFWVAPALLGTLQLFYFGTYLPQRKSEGGYRNKPRSENHGFALLRSLLTCYHFGHHGEHHEHPHAPWWKLPALQKKLSRKTL